TPSLVRGSRLPWPTRLCLSGCVRWAGAWLPSVALPRGVRVSRRCGRGPWREQTPCRAARGGLGTLLARLGRVRSRLVDSGPRWIAKEGPMPRRTPGSQRALREANQRRLIRALRSAGSLTQAQIARVTGLSAATVSNIVRELRANGTVVVSPTSSG